MRMWQLRKSGLLPQVALEFAAGASAAAAATAGGSGGTGEGAAGAGGGGGAAGSGGAAAPAQVDWNAANVPANLREGYNKLKADHDALTKQFEPWKALNIQPGDVGRFQQSHQQVYSEVKGIADTLQISEAEVADAIKAHGLLPVLDQLRYEAQQAEAAAAGDESALSEQELQQRIEAVAEQRLSPVLQRENARMVKEANTFVENTITGLATDAFKAGGLDFAGAPPELKDFILTGVTEALKYDDEGMRSVKFDGKAAPIQKAFQTFVAMWDAAYLARRTMESKLPPQRQQQGQRQQQQQAQKPPSLDEMINSPDSIRTSQGRPAYSS